MGRIAARETSCWLVRDDSRRRLEIFVGSGGVAALSIYSEQCGGAEPPTSAVS
jgi:hypothetical protein